MPTRALWLLLLAACASGCLGAPFDSRTQCLLASGATVHAELAHADCAAYERAADYARGIILDAGFADPAAYAQLERSTVFWVHAEPLLIQCYGKDVSGCEYTTGGGVQWVELPGREMNIVHEMLHGVDQLILGVPQAVTHDHGNWQTKGAAAGARVLCPPTPRGPEDCYLEGSWWDDQMHRLADTERP